MVEGWVWGGEEQGLGCRWVDGLSGGVCKWVRRSVGGRALIRLAASLARRGPPSGDDVNQVLERHAQVETLEECWTLVGQRHGRVCLARRLGYCTGEPASVEFDGAAALRREERRGDVVGFLHTHPVGPLRPSRRDVQTMRAWCSAFGKPLLCLIARDERVTGFLFEDDESEGEPLDAAEFFPGGIVVAVGAGV